MENLQENSSDKPKEKESIEQRFGRERREWTNKIESLAEDLRDIYNTSDAMVELLSRRQIALEYTHTIMGVLTKLNANLKDAKKERFLFYTQNYDLKLDKDPKNMFIESDLKNKILIQEMFQNHLQYMRGTVDTIDKLIYSIKWRIELQQYQRSQH